MRAYSVYDTKAEHFENPIYIRTDAEAIRAFTEVCNDPSSPMGKNPEDYLLYRVGSWDNEKGNFTPEPGVCVMKAIEARKGSN